MDAIKIMFAELSVLLGNANFLKVATNPVSIKKEAKLAYVLQQYTLFPKNIVSMLALAWEAAARMGWTEVRAELDRNIGQEMGSDSNNMSHYQILANSVFIEFGLNPWGVVPSASTDQFIRSMWEGLRNPSEYYVLGVAYALESSAVPELEVVLDFVNRLAASQGRYTLAPITQDFFDRHLRSWEPSHEAELHTALVPHLDTEEGRREFRAGFEHVMAAMDTWWKALSREAA